MRSRIFHRRRAEKRSEAKVLEDIRSHGWHVVNVRPAVGEEGERWSDHPPAQAAYDALFTYTVGLSITFGHPEVILVGAWEHAHPFLNVVGDMIREGARFRAGDASDEVLDGFTVRFDAVSEASRRALLTWADWVLERKPFEALQLVLPDTSGRWPEDPEYRGFPQPSLAD